MNEHKKKINYYKSFYDVSKKLNQKQFYEFNMAIYEVMFFEKDIETVSFSDNIVELLWASIKHSLSSSIEGYCCKQNIDYKGLFNTLDRGVAKGVTNNANDKEKEKEKDNVKDKDKILEVVNSSSKLNRDSFIEWLEYKKFKYQVNSINKLIEMLTQYDSYTQKEIIDNSIMNNYKGLFEPKKKTSSSLSLYEQNKQSMESFLNRINSQEILDSEVM